MKDQKYHTIDRCEPSVMTQVEFPSLAPTSGLFCEYGGCVDIGSTYPYALYVRYADRDVKHGVMCSCQVDMFQLPDALTDRVQYAMSDEQLGAALMKVEDKK